MKPQTCGREGCDKPAAPGQKFCSKDHSPLGHLTDGPPRSERHAPRPTINLADVMVAGALQEARSTYRRMLAVSAKAAEGRGDHDLAGRIRRCAEDRIGFVVGGRRG